MEESKQKKPELNKIWFTRIGKKKEIVSRIKSEKFAEENKLTRNREKNKKQKKIKETTKTDVENERDYDKSVE